MKAAHGNVFKYGDNVDTDVIIPARYLNSSDPKELATHCMEDIDKDFVKNVKAGDIITDGSVEILNPDLHIATVSKGGSLVIEMVADMGRGYNTAEKNKAPNQAIVLLFFLHSLRQPSKSFPHLL